MMLLGGGEIEGGAYLKEIDHWEKHGGRSLVGTSLIGVGLGKKFCL